MNEKLLQFIWQFGYFNKSAIQTTDGCSLSILQPGILNKHQGPDFAAAKIQLQQTVWAGSVEIHVRASDWKRHAHQGDKNYANVILHVVWEDDGYRTQQEIPVLELQSYVPKLLLHQYNSWMSSGFFIPCGEQLNQVPELIFTNWKDRLLTERLIRKTAVIKQYLEENNHHWEETLWWLMARNFGLPVNAESFEAMARSLPQRLLARHKQQIHQLEALLLGQAGLLGQDFADDYPILLQKEYRFLRKKYKLNPISIPVQFLRMRPVNFPTIRLAQLAMLVHQSVHLFSRIREICSLKDLISLLSITANDYWHYHYAADTKSAFRPKKIGRSMVDSLVINSIAPILFAYGQEHKEKIYQDRAIGWLNHLQPENNSIIRSFHQLGAKIGHAADSQSLIELKTQYCDQKRCLECAAGNALLKRNI